ncbi:hypothetical protein ACFWIA_20450 [Streptomyces sp. NPDC127068]|uniref:hypothetical protein n=1 Tax=Streptomyces sp. NPDC127068 TaxID=3347127 RepID=UPI0036589619
MSIGNGRARNGVLLGSAIDCPGGNGQDGACEGTVPPVRLVDRTDSRERAVLMGAFTDGNTQLIDRFGALGAACAAVVTSAQGVERGISAVDRLRRARAGELPVPRKALAAEEPGTPRQPRPAALWRWLVWPVTVAGAVFDSAFVGSVVQQVLDTRPGTMPYWLAYLPGLAIGVCLLVGGTFLAERLDVVRRARSVPATGQGAETGRGGRHGRRLLVAPWLFVLAVLGLIAACGVVRTQIAVRSDDAYLAAFHPVIVVLLLFLGAASVATKVLSHDPHAPQHAEETRAVKAGEKALKRRTKVADDLADTARKALVSHVATWFDLKAAADEAEHSARTCVEAAATGLVEERARTGRAGAFDYPLRSSAWPFEQDTIRDVLGPVQLKGGPELRFDMLDEVRKVLADHRPDDFASRLRTALGELDQ